MAKNIKLETATIANGATVSDTVTMNGSRIPLALELPSALTGTTLTFKSASTSGGTALPIYYEGTAYSITVSTSRHVALNRTVMEGVKYFTVVSGSAEAASRAITVITGE